MHRRITFDKFNLHWRAVAIVSLLGALTGLWSWPFWGAFLGIAACAYLLLLSRFPHAWLVVLPGLLPLLDLAPWSGRFFFDEFDILLLLTLAAGYGLSPTVNWPSSTFTRSFKLLLGLFVTSALISLVLGISPATPLDQNAFSGYYSSYNALRIGKGILWALALLPLLASLRNTGIEVGRLFAIGMCTGLAATALTVIWERATFPGLMDFSRDFRAAGLMSSMHTGGAHIEASLAMMLPFIALVGSRSGAHWTSLLIRLLLILGGVYALAVTYSRGGYFGAGIAVLILSTGWLIRRRKPASRPTMAIAVISIVGAVFVALPIVGGQFAQSRIARIAEDAQIRFDHWQDALSIRDGGWLTGLFGMGLGKYPVTYFYRSQEGSRPGSFSYFGDGDGSRLALGSGSPVYVEQRVPVSHDTPYQLEVVARQLSGNATINILLCERTFFDSFGCTSATFRLSDGWSHYESRLTLSWPTRPGRPVTLSLENASPNSIAEIRSIALRDATGHDLVQNGDFSAGSDRWFFSAFDHLAWHVKNLWVGLLFDQGWLGVIAFTLLVVNALGAIARDVWRNGDPFSLSLLASLASFLTVGIVGSLFDAPRLTFLFLLSLWVGYLHARAGEEPAEIPTVPQRHRHDVVSTTSPADTIQPLHTKELAVTGYRLLARDLAIGVTALTIALIVISKAPGIPYNIKELIYLKSPIASAAMLSVFFFWLAGVPMWLAHQLTFDTRIRFFYLPATYIHALIAALLVTLAVPSESVHDLVGSPVLGWPARLETVLRLTAVFAGLSALLTGGALLALTLPWRRHEGIVAWALGAVPPLIAAHLVAVEFAITDNLTELMAGGGSATSSTFLAGATLAFASCGSVVTISTTKRGQVASVLFLWTLLALPISLSLLVLGLENNVLKYGQHFSAMQFLVSADREHLASGVELLMRLLLAYGAGLLTLAFIQRPFTRLLQSPPHIGNFQLKHPHMSGSTHE